MKLNISSASIINLKFSRYTNDAYGLSTFLETTLSEAFHLFISGDFINNSHSAFS